MYIFMAHYTNMDSGMKIKRKIKVLDEGPEKAIYWIALGIAYDRKKKNECLRMLEFISVVC